VRVAYGKLPDTAALTPETLREAVSDLYAVIEKWCNDGVDVTHDSVVHVYRWHNEMWWAIMPVRDNPTPGCFTFDGRSFCVHSSEINSRFRFQVMHEGWVMEVGLDRVPANIFPPICFRPRE
jgi:hypothetical protein